MNSIALQLQRYLEKHQKKNARVLMKSTLQNNKTQEDLDAAKAKRTELIANVTNHTSRLTRMIVHISKIYFILPSRIVAIF